MTIWRWAIGIFLIIILGIGGFAWYLNKQLKPVLTERIKEIIKNSSDSLYTIDFADLNVNIVTGNVSFKNIVFTPDSLVYQKMKQAGTAPRHLYKVELEGLILNRVNPAKVYFKRKLEMDALIISNPKIHVFFEDVAERADTVEKETKTVYQHLSKYLKSLKVENIILQNVDFKYIDRSLIVSEVAAVKNVSVRIKDLLIDSVSQYDKTRFYYTKDIFVLIKSYKLRTKDNMYNIGFAEFTASTANRYASIKGLRVTPLYPDLAFSRKFKVQKDRYNLFFNEILLNGINFESLNSKRSLIASSLLISGSKIDIFLNRELPQPDFDKGRNYPHVALKRLRLNTIIDTVKIQNAFVNYTEYSTITKSRGTVFFRQLNGSFVNVTNDSLSLKRNNWCRADLSALLMGNGLLKVQINFNLTDPDAKFNYSGSLGPMNPRYLNQVLRPLAMVEINSGKIRKALFSVDANYRTSTGKLQLYYNDLKISVLGKNEEGTKLKKKGFASLIANALLITDNNPSPGKPFRTANSNFTRPDYASFFNLMWKSVFEGIKASVGFTAEREQQLQKSFEQMKGSKTERIDQREGRREKREERREKREKRREIK